MPELPEVHALATDLGPRLRGRVVERLEIVAFAALKTFDPPVTALSGRTVTDVTRHGKFLDIVFIDPDPLAVTFTFERFQRILEAGGRRQIKGLLRDQSVIAGIGNAYSDEILHAARIALHAGRHDTG